MLTNLEREEDHGANMQHQLMELYAILDRLLFDLVANSRDLLSLS